jgi:hypothetical protein
MVLGGPNGSGKTSILEAALLAVFADNLLQRPNALGAGAVRGGVGDYLIEGYGNYRKPFSTERAIFHRDSTRIFGVGQLPAVYFSSWRAQRYVGSLTITAGKRGKRPDQTKEENKLWIIKQFLIDSKFHDVLRAEKQPNVVIPRHQILLNKLNELWAQFHHGSDWRFVVDATEDNPESGFDVFLVRESARITTDALSSGQQELFTMLGWFLIKELNGALVVIDEPELHLDPQWHRLMLRTMQQVLPDSQFLVATHSPEVFDSVYGFQRRYLVAAGDPRAENDWIGRQAEG